MTVQKSPDEKAAGLAMLDWLEERGVPRNSAMSWVHAKLGITLGAIAEKYGVSNPRVYSICEQTPHNFATAEELVAHFNGVEAAAAKMMSRRKVGV